MTDNGVYTIMKVMVDREKLIEKLHTVPDDSLDEIRDFIDFVVERRSVVSAVSNLNAAQSEPLRRIWDNEDDDVWNDVPVR